MRMGLGKYPGDRHRELDLNIRFVSADDLQLIVRFFELLVAL